MPASHLILSLRLFLCSLLPLFFFSLSVRAILPRKSCGEQVQKLSLIHKGRKYFAYGVFVTYQKGGGQQMVFPMHLQLSPEIEEELIDWRTQALQCILSLFSPSSAF